MIRWFIGYDEVESVAYHTFVNSIIKRSSVPVSITPVKLSHIKEYTRPRDSKQSNEFSFSRFLVPWLCGFEGKAIFSDCDMMLLDDPAKLFDQCPSDKAVSVVKHDYTPSTATKYLGAVQHPYPRKNWSSVMLFNCGHHDCKKLTPEYVNNAPALDLHRFKWTEDDQIGEISADWNHLVGEYEPNRNAKLVHFTIGGPYFKEYQDVEFSDEWFDEYFDMVKCKQQSDVTK